MSKMPWKLGLSNQPSNTAAAEDEDEQSANQFYT
jgi:hypothetical protein